MKLLAVNGSPRGLKSNTRQIISYFIQGYTANADHQAECIDLMQCPFEECARRIRAADILLLAFPLYVLCMPGIVKELLEKLPPDIGSGKKFVGFIQSGFPETHQFDLITGYLRIIAKKLNFDYSGTIIKGYGASIEMMPMMFNKSFLKKFFSLGRVYGAERFLDDRIVQGFQKPRRFSLGQVAFYKFLRFTGALDAYTGVMLKKHGVSSEQSLAKPL